MASSKVENAKRLRYIRVLERFLHSIVSYLSKTEELSKEVFEKKVRNNLRYYERVEPVKLYKGEYSDIETLVKRIITLSESDTAIDEIKNDIVYRANQIDKSMNARRYKKEKHAKGKFGEWE